MLWRKCAPKGMLWTPTEMTTDLWMDASDASTITLNGARVSQWNDKSGNTRHWTQSNTSYQPDYQSGTVNGLNAVGFNGSSYYLERINTDKGLTVTTDMTVFEVFGRASAGIVTQCMGGLTNSVPPYALQWDTDNGRYSGLGSTTGIYATHGSANTSTGTFLSTLKRNSSDVTLWVDGSQVGTPRTPTSMSSGSLVIVSVGRRTTKYHNGRILEIISVQSSMSDTDRQKIEGYLAWKWGLQSKLPSGHPYLDFAPTK